MFKSERIADALAGGSIVTFLGLTLSEVDHIVSIGAGLAAILAGLCASYYHLSKARQRRDKQD